LCPAPLPPKKNNLSSSKKNKMGPINIYESMLWWDLGHGKKKERGKRRVFFMDINFQKKRDLLERHEKKKQCVVLAS